MIASSRFRTGSAIPGSRGAPQAPLPCSALTGLSPLRLYLRHGFPMNSAEFRRENPISAASSNGLYPDVLRMDVSPEASTQVLRSCGKEIRTLDLVHLARMTLGDRALEAEVLALFLRQSATLAERAGRADETQLAALAHTLTGSARAVGAWRVANCAERLEALACGSRAGMDPVIAELRQAVDEVRALIAGILQPA